MCEHANAHVPSCTLLAVKNVLSHEITSGFILDQQMSQ